MADDARFSTALASHPKTRKLHRRLGAEGCWSLVCLFLWVANNRWEGKLSGMSDEDIELAADWPGESGALVQTLREVGFLDGEPGNYSVHDWAEHNPWAANRGQRVQMARRAAAARWENGRNAESMPTACDPNTDRMHGDENRNAHHPTQPNQSISSDSCDPDSPLPTATMPRMDLNAAFEGVWGYYLEKVGRNPKTYSLTPLRRRKGLARLEECLKKTRGDVNRAIALMKLCVDALVASDWHMGRDPKTNGSRYCEWEDHLFGSYEQMEKWWNR
jgi:hypothetical protein